MLLLDGLNTEIADQANDRQEILKFLQQIQPQDRLAIFTLGRVLQEFTNDSSRLVAALRRYSGQTTLEASAPTDIQAGDQNIDALLQDAFQRESNTYIQDRVRTTVDALIDIAHRTAALPGRKSLVWLPGSFPFSVGYENLQNIVQMMNDPHREANLSGQQLVFAEDIERAARALNDANVAVYPVDARGLLGLNMNTTKGSNKGPGYGAMNTNPQNGNLGGGRGSRAGGAFNNHRLRNPATNSSLKAGPTDPMLNPDSTTFETMDALAHGTGGKAFYNSNDISGSLRSAINDSRLTYELGYYPAGGKWDGSFHSVTVQVRKPDVVVRARKGDFALPDPLPTEESIRNSVSNAVVSPLESTEMGLAVRVSAATRSHGIALSAMLFFNPHSIQFVMKDGQFTASANIVLAQLNDKNQILSAAQQAFPLHLSSGEYQQFLKQQAELTQEIGLLPGVVKLRVVLCDGTTGRLGSVTVPLAKYLQVKPTSN